MVFLICNFIFSVSWACEKITIQRWCHSNWGILAGLQGMVLYSLYIQKTVLYFKISKIPIPKPIMPHHHITRNKNLIILEQPNLVLKILALLGQQFFSKLPLQIKIQDDIGKCFWLNVHFTILNSFY